MKQFFLRPLFLCVLFCAMLTGISRGAVSYWRHQAQALHARGGGIDGAVHRPVRAVDANLFSRDAPDDFRAAACCFAPETGSRRMLMHVE